ncbi:MAG: DsrE/DsrF/DrsH-like family protein [Candidatus Aminicenantes bacterium]|jgi:peroxiredoxin family protein|nr:DsrE/DsrF/DrsH-like family protein [Candidatus Aminicenantes bacterium]
MSEKPVEKASIIVMSGDMDKVIGALIIANGAAAFDMQVSMFFTFWGLKVIQKGNLTGKGVMGKMLGLMNRGDINRLNPSKLSFGGMGRWMFKKMMKKNNVMPLPEMLKQAQAQGVKLTACEMTMNVMEIAKEDLIDGVQIGGVASFIADASESKFTLFI